MDQFADNNNKWRSQYVWTIPLVDYYTCITLTNEQVEEDWDSNHCTYDCTHQKFNNLLPNLFKVLRSTTGKYISSILSSQHSEEKNHNWLHKCGIQF